MSRDEAHDALGCPIRARELRAAARVVEVARERRISRREARADAWSERLEDHARDPVPQQRVRWFRAVVKDARNDELLIRPELAEDSRGLGGVPVVRAGRTEVPDRLLHAVEHG